MFMRSMVTWALRARISLHPAKTLITDSSGPPPSQFDVSASSSLILMAICALAILQDLAFVKSRRSREDVSACSLIVAIVSSTLHSSTSQQVKT